MNSQDELLDRPPEVAVRTLALRYLDQAAAAAVDLGTDTDAEALHDFRVALRRLRTLLKAYREELRDSVSKKQARALRDLARSTGGARDAEVQLEWLSAQREQLKPAARRAWSWMVERLEARCKTAYAAVRGDDLRRFERIESELRGDLSRYRATLDAATGRATFAAVLAEGMRENAAELVRALEAVHAPTDAEEAHCARIQGKRFRYLLEPLQETSLRPPAARLIGSVKALQEVLGNLHDMHVLAAEIANWLVETAAERARTLHEALYVSDPTPPGKDLRAGILAIDRLVRDRVDALFREVQARWPAAEVARFSAEVEALAATLHRRAGRAAGSERRSFLLSSLPALASAPADVTQGWIPGRTLRERLEKVVSGGEERFYRTVANGTGPELEEEASRELFERLWPLTEGRQARKRRYRVVAPSADPGKAQTWEVDEFLDRDLVLAAIEPSGADEPVELPAWLQPYVVREVTGESQYRDDNLAR